MRAVEAFESTVKRARALTRAHATLRGRGPGKRPRFHSELLRAAVVTSVSAMDAYFNDRVLENVRRTIKDTAPDFPNELVLLITEDEKMEPLIREFLKLAMRDRPLAHVTTMIAHKLSERTFQDPGRIEWGTKVIGVRDFWNQVAQRMNEPVIQAKRTLMQYVRRRHDIVHRGDLGAAKKIRHKVRKISPLFASSCINHIDRFVHCAEEVISAG